MGLSPDKYLQALHAAGVPRGLPVLEIDRQAASILKVNKRTARRYRKGEQQIPGTVIELLRALRRRQRPSPTAISAVFAERCGGVSAGCGNLLDGKSGAHRLSVRGRNLTG